MDFKDNSLFTDDFPSVNNQVELQKIQEQFKEYDEYYVTCGCMPEKRKMIEDLWKTYQPYADKHFLKQYKNIGQFHQRIWEMYMGCVLLEKGFSIKTINEGPDFVVNESYYIECVACNNAELENEDRVPNEVISYDKQPINSGFSDVNLIDHPERQIIIRITNSVSDKLCQYKNWANKPWFDKNKSYIIALNSGIFPYIQEIFGVPIIINALFGLEYPMLNLETEQIDYSWRESIQKGSTLVSVNGFTNDTMKEISAILFSYKDAINHPPKIGDDCCLINNPFAFNPINMDKFKTFKWWFADKEGKITRLEDK